jgi:hypothetical protein
MINKQPLGISRRGFMVLSTMKPLARNDIPLYIMCIGWRMICTKNENFTLFIQLTG